MATLEETLTLSAPKVQINGQTVKIIPGSVEVDAGLGERKVRAVSSGGNSVDMVVGVDVEQMVVAVKLSLAHTAENLRLVEKLSDDANRGIPATMKIIEQTKQRAFQQMYLTNKPTAKYEAEGAIDLEFAGKQVL